jgi:hypothetical protein
MSAIFGLELMKSVHRILPRLAMALGCALVVNDASAQNLTHHFTFDGPVFGESPLSHLSCVSLRFHGFEEDRDLETP